MTVTTTTRSVVYTGNGATTEFSYGFKIQSEDQLVVQRLDATTGEVLETYTQGELTIEGVGTNFGSVTIAGDPVSSDYKIAIARVVEPKQNLDIVNAKGFYPDTVEEQLDLIVMSLQEVYDIANRSVHLPIGSSGFSLPLDREGKFITFDADGAAVMSEGTGSDAALRSDLAALTGAALIGFKVEGSAETSRSLRKNFGEHGLNLKSYGSNVGNGNATDDTAAWQAALNDMSATGIKRLIVPAGVEYLINETISAPASLDCIQVVAMGGYDGIRAPGNDGLFTSLKWVGATDATKAVICFNRSNGIIWSGISIDCDYKAGFGLQLRSSMNTDPGVKNIIENMTVANATRDGIIVGDWGTPTASPGERQFFGNEFHNITGHGCKYSVIHINEWNADQQLFVNVMGYLDQVSDQPTYNMIWFDYGGQASTLINCQSGGMTVDPLIPTSGFAILNKANDSGSVGAFGLTMIGLWQEGAGGLYYGTTGSSEGQGMLFLNCTSFTSDTNNPSVVIDKGTSSQVPHTFVGGTYKGDIRIDSDTFDKRHLSLVNVNFAANKGVVYGGVRVVDGLVIKVGSGGTTYTVPKYADSVHLVLDQNLTNLYAPGATKRNDRLVLILTQNGTGGWTVGFDSDSFYTLPPIPAPDTSAGAKTVYTFVSDGTKYYLAAFNGIQSAAIVDAATNAVTAHALNSTFSDTEVENALNALATIINANAVKQNAALADMRLRLNIAT